MIQRLRRPKLKHDQYSKIYCTLITGADVTKDDGIYSGYLTKFSGDGMITVDIVISNDGEAARTLDENTFPLLLSMTCSRNA